MTYVTDTGHRTEGSLEPTSDHVVICGNAELDIAGAQELYSSLRTALQTRQPITFDLGQVERVDTAIIQMLCAFVREAQTMGVSVQWQQASPTIQQAARRLNVEAYLALPEVSQQDGRGTTGNVEKQ